MQSKLTEIEFEQKQPIHVAIRNLIHDYPADEGILKELIQNADDGEATEIRFILDTTHHGDISGPIDAWHEFARPALLVTNNKPFRERDLKNICNLGDSGKIETPHVTGRYGRGFNSVYNITDSPLLLTRDSVCYFDPCRFFGSRGGSRWKIDALFLQEHSQALNIFKPAGFSNANGFHDGSIFRFPFRSELKGESSHDRLKDECFKPDQFVSLVDGLKNLAEHILLFLRNIQFIGCYHQKEPNTEPEVLLEIKTNNIESVCFGRSVINEFLEKPTTSAVLGGIRAEEKGSIESTYIHKVTVTTPARSSKYKWMVTSGLYCGRNNKLFEISRQLNQSNERAIPGVGVAVCIERDGEPYPTVEGTVSCYLPLPRILGEHAIPFHINGAFDLDGSRSGLTKQKPGESGSTKYRAMWNSALINLAVTEAIATNISECLSVKDTNTNQVYKLFPNTAHPLPAPFDGFHIAVYGRLAGLAVFRNGKGELCEANLLRLTSYDPYDPKFQKCLEIEKFSIPSPPLPLHIIEGLILADSLPPKLGGVNK